jgi:hypothetical protein
MPIIRSVQGSWGRPAKALGWTIARSPKESNPGIVKVRFQMLPSEMLRREVHAAGKALIEALRTEQGLTSMNADVVPDVASLEKWRQFRGDVDRLAERYRMLVGQFGEPLEDEFVRSGLTERAPDEAPGSAAPTINCSIGASRSRWPAKSAVLVKRYLFTVLTDGAMSTTFSSIYAVVNTGVRGICAGVPCPSVLRVRNCWR